ncbi:hypothetical protein CAPTEDRAFT_227741 [Capitella teleta]|uniref:Methyltransferase FkbM domain-containing protein n=1 Tax=Capitella teleta TaxID=283909 RepID=R7UNH9_CAPTE|nr:hypothetical protein CAPTEDRAFT_227741 [Capitella teleta]|eukprot:ELU08064.1 hypothetical protein CAPTEDRAFT_227741 [Capitella teleta]
MPNRHRFALKMDIYGQTRLSRYHPPSVRMPLTKMKVWIKGSKIGPSWGRNRLVRYTIFAFLGLSVLSTMLHVISQKGFAIPENYNKVEEVSSDMEKELTDYIVKEDFLKTAAEASFEDIPNSEIDEVEGGRPASETILDSAWPIHAPINLSMSNDNVDIGRMRALTSLLDRHSSISCSHLSLMQHLKFVACPYTEDEFSDAESDRESSRMGPLLWRLFQRDDLDLIDIGASIGLHTLAAASIGRRVVAIEPVKANQKRLIKAAIVNECSENIILVPYAVSNSRIKLKFKIPRNNQAKAFGTDDDCVSDERFVCSDVVSTVVLDELLPWIPFNNALLRMGTSDFALESVVQSKRLLVNVKVSVICMTWTQYARKWTGGSRVRQRVDDMVKYMHTKMDYEPRDEIDQPLVSTEWGSWPDIVFWTKHTLIK